MDHREALDKTLKVFKLKAADIAEKAGMGANELSRYRRGHTDILAGRAFQIVRAMPLPAQLYYWGLCLEETLPVNNDREHNIRSI
jgi:transcriptional regulator with XRE-family HTH domain